MLNLNINRPIIIVCKDSLAAKKEALELLNNPIQRYANEYDIEFIFSIPQDRGILIEELHYKANTDLIYDAIINYRGQVVMTSFNKKDIPKKISKLCKFRLLKAQNETFSDYTKNSEPPIDANMSIFDLIHDFIKNKNREVVAERLKLNKPYDEQFLSWLALNVHPSKIAYLDAKVKRRWSQDYFYELLAYSHDGSYSRKVQIPSRRQYDKRTSLCKRIGLKSDELYLLEQLVENEDFKKYVQTKINNSESRLLKLGEKKKPKKKTTIKTKATTLNDYI